MKGLAQAGKWWNWKFVWPHLEGSTCFTVEESFGKEEADTWAGSREKPERWEGWHHAPLLLVPGGSPESERTPSHHDGALSGFLLALSSSCADTLLPGCADGHFLGSLPQPWWPPARKPCPGRLADPRENDRDGWCHCSCRAQPLQSPTWTQWALPLHTCGRTWVRLERRVCTFA